MVKVAIAGGLGKLGKTIAEASENSDIPVIAVDYTNVDDLRTALETNQVHTVISALLVMDEVTGQSQVNLIKAANKSSSTKRFVLSEYGIPVPPNATEVLLFIKFSQAAVEEARKTSLEFTGIHNGHLLDYFGRPHIKSYQASLTFVLDVANKTAAIPGTGNEPIVLTYSFDVAKFVAAALDLPEWPEELFVIGDRITFNEFVKLAEEARGAKFDVRYEDPERLKRLEMQVFVAAYENWLVEGYYDLPRERTLNEKFPEIKTLTVREMLEQNWKGK